MLTIWKITWISTGLAAGNFGWQVFGSGLWDIAVERTYFQFAALMVAWLVERLLIEEQ